MSSALGPDPERGVFGAVLQYLCSAVSLQSVGRWISPVISVTLWMSLSS